MANEFKIRKGLIVEGASGGTVVNVLGSQGQLLSVTDDLSGSIFAVSDISGVPIFDVNSSGLSTFDGSLQVTNSADTVAKFNRLSDDGEIIRFQQGNGTDGAINSLSGRIAIGSGNTGIFFDSIRQVVTPHNMTTNGNEFNNISFGRTLIRFKDIYLSGKVVAGTGSTAAATINAFSTTVSTGLHSALRVIENTSASSYWDIGATNGASTLLNFHHNANTTPKISFTHTGGATFAGKATSSATVAADGSTTLTTKSYVDGLVTGVPVYKGTWAAGTTGVTSAAINGTTITLTAAPVEVIAVGDVVTADGITAATTVTAVASQTSVTVSATVVIATGITVTFSPEGGYPDLTLAAAKVLGNYYIVSTAGAATPNGSGVEPDSWAVGDWCIFSDVTPGAGTDLWQRIDNSSVISGAGTGKTIPLWEGETNANSETLTDSPITVSGNDTTFAGGASISTASGLAATAPVFLSDSASRVLYLKGNNIIQFQNTSGDNKWENVGRDGEYYVYKNDGTGSGMKYRIDTSGNHAFTGVVTLNSGALNLSGTGRIQGVDTVTAGTDAANKDYVDTKAGLYLPLVGGTLTGDLFVGQASMMHSPANGGRIGFNRNTSTGAILNSAYAAFQINGAYANADYLEIQNYASTGGFLGSIVLKGGNLGIGTGSDINAKLDVDQEMKAGTTAAFTDPHLRLSANNTVDNTGFVGMTFATSSADNYGFSWGALRTTSALGGMHLRYHQNSASGNDIFNIDYTGNITIPTTRYIRSDSSSGYLLIQGGATYPGGRIDMYGGSHSSPGIQFMTGGATTIPTERLRLLHDGQFWIKLLSTTSGREASMANDNDKLQIFGSRHGGTGKYVSIWSDGANENARFYPTNTIFYKNVGINSTNPGSKLVVAGGTDTAYNDGTLKVVGSIALNAANNLNPSLNRWALRPRAAGVEGSFDIYDARHSLSRLTIVNSGNVGIGEASPTAKLEVYNSGGTVFNATGSQGQLFSVTDDLSGEIFAVADISGVPIMTVNSSGVSYFDGKVGIGTSSPATQLHVESDNPIITLQRNNNGNASGALQFRGSDNVVDWQVGTNQVVGLGLEFNFQNSNKVYIETGGDVGIGTTVPDEKLTVNGITRAVDPIYFGAINTANQTYGPYIESYDDKGLKFDFNGNNGGEFQIWNHDANGGGATEVFTIEQDNDIFMPSGNVTIGKTTAALGRLDVDGTFIVSVGTQVRFRAFYTGGYTFLNGGTNGSTIYFGAPTSNVQNIRVQGTATATNFILSSDETLKDNIKNINNNHIDVDWKNFELKSEPGSKTIWCYSTRVRGRNTQSS